MAHSSSLQDIQQYVYNTIEQWDGTHYIHFDKSAIQALQIAAEQKDTQSMICLASAFGHAWVSGASTHQALLLFEDALALGDLNAILPLVKFIACSDQSYSCMAYQKVLLDIAFQHYLIDSYPDFIQIDLHKISNVTPGFGFYGQNSINGTPFLDRSEFCRSLLQKLSNKRSLLPSFLH